MKHILIRLTLISLPFLTSSCPKNGQIILKPGPEVLPPAIQTGANTFGFSLNGKVWLPEGPGAMRFDTIYDN